jgi:DNA-binding response OmpR family regulator
MKILLVEDDALLASEIAAALRRENFAVDTAADGEEGIISATPKSMTLRCSISACRRCRARPSCAPGASAAGNCRC